MLSGESARLRFRERLRQWEEWEDERNGVTSVAER